MQGEWPILLKLGGPFTVQIATMNIGFNNTTGAMSAILISTNPVFAALFAHFLISGDRLSAVKGLGLMIAFSGIVLVLIVLVLIVLVLIVLVLIDDGSLAELTLDS